MATRGKSKRNYTEGQFGGCGIPKIANNKPYMLYFVAYILQECDSDFFKEINIAKQWDYLKCW